MSYCRFLEGDVYVYMDVAGHLTCSVCSLLPEDGPSGFYAHSTQEMISHLQEHRKAGDRIPSGVFSDLWADDERNFPNNREQKIDALKEMIRLGEELRAADPETFDVNEHWVNNPLISPKSKVYQFEEWEKRIRKEERERVSKVAQNWISEMRGHDGECNCKHEATVLQQFIEHEEFKGETID